MLHDVSKQRNWESERDDRHEIQGLIFAGIVGLCFWAVVIGWFVE